MGKNAKYFRAALAAFFLVTVFSCKSTAPSAETGKAQIRDKVESSAEREAASEDSPPAASEPHASAGAEGERGELSPEPLSSAGPSSARTSSVQPPVSPDVLAAPEAEAVASAARDTPREETPEPDGPETSFPPHLPLSEEAAEYPELPSLTLPPPAAPPNRAAESLPLPKSAAAAPDSPPAVSADRGPARPPVSGTAAGPIEGASPPPIVAEPPALPRQSPSSPKEITEQRPDPPAFLRPAEPVIPPPAREPVTMPINPLPDLPARTPPADTGEQIVFSRTVRATTGQIVEIPFRGTGWVYLGELGNRRGISYDSRRLDLSSGNIEGQSFIFRTEAAGTYILKFYRQDFIQDYIINDYVQIIVGDESDITGILRFQAERDRIIAEPRWPPAAGADNVPVTGSSAGAAAADSRQAAGSASQTAAAIPPAAASQPEAPQSSPPAATPRPRQGAADDGIAPAPQAVSPAIRSQIDLPPNAAPAEYVSRARQEYNAGRVESALGILDAMKQRFPSGTDEAWWLYGQLLESNSASRDIRLALEYYRRLVREYPQSGRVPDADRRIAYLERYFFNIR